MAKKRNDRKKMSFRDVGEMEQKLFLLHRHSYSQSPNFLQGVLSLLWKLRWCKPQQPCLSKPFHSASVIGLLLLCSPFPLPVILLAPILNSPKFEFLKIKHKIDFVKKLFMKIREGRKRLQKHSQVGNDSFLADLRMQQRQLAVLTVAF